MKRQWIGSLLLLQLWGCGSQSALQSGTAVGPNPLLSAPAAPNSPPSGGPSPSPPPPVFTIERVSVASDGTQGNRDSGLIDGLALPGGLSADGRRIAFVARASNLVASDTNDREDIFVRDRQTGQTVRASLASDGTEANNSSFFALLSGDGRSVLFSSRASNLVAGDTNGRTDVFVHDLETGQTSRVSVASDGSEGNSSSGELGADSLAISADGRWVCFVSRSSNLVAGDTNGRDDLFVHDRQTGQTTRVSRASDGSQANGDSFYPTLSADGRFVAFSSFASNLAPGDIDNVDVFVHDRQNGQTSLVSRAADGTQGNGESFHPSLSADGRFVAFDSSASNLVPGDTNSVTDAFVHDRQTGQSMRISVSSSGTQGSRFSLAPSLSADGRYVSFASRAPDLVPGDTNNRDDVFVHDRQTGETVRLSVAFDGTEGGEVSTLPWMSADGRQVAFLSFAANLVAGDTNGVCDVFVARNLLAP